MRSFLYRATRRRFLSLLLGALAFLYSFSLLIYVQFIPDLGLRSAFTTALKIPPKLVEGTPPPAGSVIRKVGSHEIRSWSNLVKSPFWVQRDLAYIRDAGSPQPDWVKLEDVDGDDPKTWIRIEYDPPGNGAETHVAWCQLGQLPTEERLPTLLWFLLKVFLFLIGVLAYWKRPKEKATALFYFMTIATLVAFTGGYHWAQMVNHPVYILGFMIAGVLMPAFTFHFYQEFPRPKPWLLRYPRRIKWALYGIPILFLTVMLACYVRIRIDVRNNGDAAQALEFLAGVVLAYLGVTGIYFLGSIACLFHSWRHAQDTLERNQVKWILFGWLAAVVPVSYATYLAFWQPNRFAVGAGTWPIFAASALLTLAYAISITRYRLLEIDKLLTTSVGYFLSSFLAAILYYAVVFLGTLIFNQVLSGPKLNETLAVSASALLMLVVLDQFRWRIRKALDRRFSHDQSQLDRTFERMGKAIEQLVDSQALVQKLLQSTTDLLGVQQASAFVRDGDRLRLAGSVGATPPMAELELGFPLCDQLMQGRVMLGKVRTPHLLTPAQKQLLFLGGEVGQPILDEGKLLGFLVLGPKETGWRQQDFDLLSAFAQIGALALENAEGHRTIEVLNQDLQGKIKKIGEQQRRIFALQTQLHRQTLAPDQANAEPAMSDAAETPAETTAPPAVVGPGGVVGTGEEVGKLNALVRKVAATDAVVLIRGESGTGKELVAKAVHETSGRAEKPFVKVHCAALSSNLLESELFGHVKGAFTGAHRDKVGRFEMADGGTLFLDEIGDVSLEVQTKLLRVLQERTFERVGSSDSIKVDVRILAATHQSLENLIKQGKFREDLFYRLNVFPVVVPPLRNRIEDIPELAMHFVRLSAARCKKPVKGLDDEALLALKNFSWPGNIRQLENTIERAVVIAEGEIVTVDEMPSELFTLTRETISSLRQSPSFAASKAPPRVGTMRSERERIERERMLEALAAAGGNKAEAARVLGMARSTLLSRMKKLGIE